MKRKLSEDPLLFIRKQEEETKRKITSNPVKMKQLQMLVSVLLILQNIKNHIFFVKVQYWNNIFYCLSITMYLLDIL